MRNSSGTCIFKVFDGLGGEAAQSNLKSMMVSRHTMNHHDTGKHIC